MRSAAILLFFSALVPVGECSSFAGAGGTAQSARRDPPEWRRERPRLQRRRWDALEGRPAPALSTLGGWRNTAPLSWRSLRGRLVLVCVWTMEGQPPERPLQRLGGLAARCSEDLSVLVVHSGEPDAGALNLLERYGPKLPFASDASGDFVGALAVRRPPAYFLVDRGGRVRVAGVSPRLDAEGRSVLGLVIEAVASEGAALSGVFANADAKTLQRVAALEARLDAVIQLRANRLVRLQALSQAMRLVQSG